MYNRKPDKTLDEDLKALGLLAEEESADKKAPEAEEKEEKAEEERKAKEAKADKKKAHAEPDGDEDEEGEEPASKLEAAWGVIKEYYKLDEGADDLVAEDFRAVISAFATVLESALNPGEPTKKPEELPGGDDNKMFPAGQDPNKQKVAGPLAPKKANMKYGVSKTDKEAPADYQRSSEVKTESLDDLVSELKSLQSNLQESTATAEKLMEGFDAIRATAAEIAGRIGLDLEESKTEVSENDERVVLGNYFASIAEDAENVLKVVSEGNADLDVVANDLKTLSDDLKKGLAKLETA